MLLWVLKAEGKRLDFWDRSKFKPLRWFGTGKASGCCNKSATDAEPTLAIRHPVDSKFQISTNCWAFRMSVSFMLSISNWRLS